MRTEIKIMETDLIRMKTNVFKVLEFGIYGGVSLTWRKALAVVDKMQNQSENKRYWIKYE